MVSSYSTFATQKKANKYSGLAINTSVQDILCKVGTPLVINPSIASNKARTSQSQHKPHNWIVIFQL